MSWLFILTAFVRFRTFGAAHLKLSRGHRHELHTQVIRAVRKLRTLLGGPKAPSRYRQTTCSDGKGHCQHTPRSTHAIVINHALPLRCFHTPPLYSFYLQFLTSSPPESPWAHPGWIRPRRAIAH